MRKPNGISFEKFAEQQLKAAFEAGEFQRLPGHGRPIPGIDEPLDENWWIKKKLRDEQVSLLPPLLEAKRDIQQTRERIRTIRSETRVRVELEKLRDRVRKALDSPAPSPPVYVMPVDLESELAAWRRERGPSA